MMAGRRGRRPRADTASTHTVRFLVTESERKELQAVAKENGQPVSTLIRDAVNEFVSDYKERSLFRR